MEVWRLIAVATVFGAIGVLTGSVAFVSLATFILVLALIRELEEKTKLSELGEKLVALAIFVLLVSIVPIQYAQQIYQASLYLFAAGVVLTGLEILYSLLRVVAKK